MLSCNICEKPFDLPLYTSPSNLSINSIGKQFQGTTRVFFCDHCGHLQTMELEDPKKFYSEDYNFLIAEEEEDQLYTVIDGKTVYRQDHQLATLIGKLAIPNHSRILDYGCGKGAFAKKLVSIRPDLEPFLFDVSEVYIPFWEKFMKPGNWATFHPRPDWECSFDVVFSLFSLEHITNPKHVVANIARLLKPGGLFYIIVPNPYGVYIADFLVIDHVNHFSESSIRYLLHSSGFQIVDIDSASHDVAFIVIAKKSDDLLEDHTCAKGNDRQIPALKTQAEAIGKFWHDARDRIRLFEKDHAGKGGSAIYGAGVVGSFIACSLKDLSQVKCFIDQNAFKQRQTLLDKPIIPPAGLDPRTNVIYVGLCPLAGRKAIEGITAWRNLNHYYFYL